MSNNREKVQRKPYLTSFKAMAEAKLMIINSAHRLDPKIMQMKLIRLGLDKSCFKYKRWASTKWDEFCLVKFFENEKKKTCK